MPLFWLSITFMAGIVFSARMHWPTSTWLVIAGINLILLLVITWWKKRVGIAERPEASRFIFSPQFFLLILVSFTLGAARFQVSQPDLHSPEFIAFYNDADKEVRVLGLIIKPPEEQDNRLVLRVRVEGVQPYGESMFTPVRGLMVARVSNEDDWEYGDRIMLRGELETPPEFEDFSYRAYLAQQGVYSYMRSARIYRTSSGGGNVILRAIYAYKKHALSTLYRLWPDPEASLLAGILLGVESGIPDDVDQAFRDTGTSHIIVISGFNITIIIGLLVGVFSRVFGGGQTGVRRAAVIALTGIAAYTVLVGGDAAVVRAAVMGATAVFASLVGRRQDGLNTLAVVAGLMAAFNPQVLWNIGFQLSFAATLGLVLYAEQLKTAFENWAARFVAVETAQKWSQPVGEYIIYTLAAQVLVLPIIIFYFQRISISSLIANPLILPAQPPVMILGGLALLAGTISYPLGQLLAWVAWPFVAYTIRVVEFLASFPGGALNLGEVSLVVVLAFYAILFGFTFAGNRSEKVDRELKPGAIFTGLVVLTILIWRVVFAAPDGRLHITLLDVGTGDAILIQTPTGRRILVDGGPSSRSLSDGLGRRLPFGQRSLDWLVVAATGEGQVGGLRSNIERFPAKQVLWAGPISGSYQVRDLQAKLTELDLPIVPAREGQVLDLGEGAELEVLEVCDRGAVLLLKWGTFRTLLPIGLDFDTLDHLRTHTELRGVTALLLAESGFAPVNPGDWIKDLSPQVVLLSVAAGDLEGLPSPETINALEGFNLLRTDHNGWIELTTDGTQMWVEVKRN
jgi:competence protein ComEC